MSTSITSARAPIAHADQRVAVFIDAQNLYHSAQHMFGGNPNFSEILKSVVAGRKLIRAIAYVIRGKAGTEQAFFDALVKVGIEAKEKDLQEFSSGAKKADWDVGLAIDAVRIVELVDVVVLMSGDGDFVPLVAYLQHRGRRVEVAAFRPTTSGKLQEGADAFIDLASDPKRYVIRARRRGTRTGRTTDLASEPNPLLES
ncbi:NYN domain-containing protein [Candidatus Uhrbacteria bacterium]|nr:NYN domain-containing protein [Candidatus Uhrbacteria bacterium]